MRWVTVVAAAVVLALGVFVAAIPPASIEARAHAAPFATDEPGAQGPDDGSDDAQSDADDDDSDELAQEQEDEEWQEQQEQDEEQAQ